MKMFHAVYHILKFPVMKAKYISLCHRCKLGSEDIFAESENHILLLTHNYGGGTLTYENNLITESKEKFIVLRMISYGKNLAMKIERDGKTFYLPSNFLNSVFENKFKSVIVNSLLSFYHNEKIIPFLSDYKRKNPDVRFTVMMHDFYPVCPHFNLVADNWNCNLECEKHKCKFDNFVEKFNGAITEWRKIWMKLLPLVDEIRCFSNSSKEIIKKAYPNLKDEKITVVPHSLDYIKFTPIKNVEKLPLHIGIVGSVFTVPKGKLVVRELLKRIPEEIPISIIGATKHDIGGIRRKNTHYLGKYKHDDLQRLVEDETISMEFFPSIWSETFSYLVSEHIAMNEPVVCFDMGAQAEKVRTYNKGIVVKNVDEMVDVIMEKKNYGSKSCYQRLY